MFSWLFPTYCCLCRREGSDFCTPCLDKLKKAPRAMRCTLCALPQPQGHCCPKHRGDIPLIDLLTVFRYQAPEVRTLVRAFKYKQRPHMYTILVPFMVEMLRRYVGSVSWLVVPIPSPAKRRSARSYVPTELLARGIAELLHFPTQNVLTCTRNPRKQMELGRAERRQNMRHVFAWQESSMPDVKGIILVDDVITTGSTLLEAASVCQRAVPHMPVLGITFAQNS